MVQSRDRLGTDLRLLRNLEWQQERDRGQDLSIQTGRADLETLSGADNLKQALLLRFLTYQGELTSLGHANYGSRLHELIGERNTPSTRNRAKFFVLETLAAEPRIKEIRSVQVRQNRSHPNRLDIDITLVPVDGSTPLNLVFPFFLEGGVS